MKIALSMFLGAVLLVGVAADAQAAKHPRGPLPRFAGAAPAAGRFTRDIEELPVPPPGDELTPGDGEPSPDELQFPGDFPRDDARRPAERELLEPRVEREIEPLIRPISVAQFASAFRPAGGDYRVLLLHPCTGQPVEVCFHLPCARLEEFNVRRHELEFEYDDFEVEIRFKRDGRVRVVYDD